MKISKAMVDAYLAGDRNEAEIMTKICKDQELSHTETVNLIDDITKFTLEESKNGK